MPCTTVTLMDFPGPTLPPNSGCLKKESGNCVSVLKRKMKERPGRNRRVNSLKPPQGKHPAKWKNHRALTGSKSFFHAYHQHSKQQPNGTGQLLTGAYLYFKT